MTFLETPVDLLLKSDRMWDFWEKMEGKNMEFVDAYHLECFLEDNDLSSICQIANGHNGNLLPRIKYTLHFSLY